MTALAARLLRVGDKNSEPESISTAMTEIGGDEDDNEAAGSNDDDMITADLVVTVFDSIFVHMQGVLSQLGQQIQQIQMSGQTIPEKQLRQLLKAEFERALLAQQSKIYEANDVDEEQLELATWEFLQDDKHGSPKVKKAVERFQKLYENVTGETVVTNSSSNTTATGGEELLTKEKLLAAAQVYFDALTASMVSVVQAFKDQGANLYDPSVAQQLQLQFAKVANQAGEKALENMGISQDLFRQSIEKHANNPEVGRVLSMLQMKQQKDLVAMGVPAM